MDERAAGAWRRADRPLILGHRGVRGTLPENTLAAFEAAAGEGADGIELDVRVCGTGELVVVHDPTLERVTSGRDLRAIAEMAHDELARVDVGDGQRVPTLTEALALARTRRLRVNVEMKRDAPDRTAIVRATARVLRRWDPNHPVLVSSFDPLMLAGLALLAPDVPRALLIGRLSVKRRAPLFARPVRVLAVHLDRVLTSADAVRAWKRKGMLVNVWTVNDAVEARDLRAIGVDGIITDAPARIRDALV